jgi:hypothetical protein
VVVIRAWIGIGLLLTAIGGIAAAAAWLRNSESSFSIAES